MERKDRLKKVVALQEKLQRLHETKQAGHMAAAIRAATEAEEVAARFDADDSLATLFPEVYHRRIAMMNEQRAVSLAAAQVEAGRVAEAKMRAQASTRAYRDALAAFDRKVEEKQQLETLERRLIVPK